MQRIASLVLDGVYRRTEGEPVFVEVRAPTDEALQAMLHKGHRPPDEAADPARRTRRRGGGATYLADSDSDGDGDSDDARALRPLQAAAWPCRPRRASGPAPRQALCDNGQGFSPAACIAAGPI